MSGKKIYCISCGATMYEQEPSCPACGAANILIQQKKQPPLPTPPPIPHPSEPTYYPSSPYQEAPNVSSPGLAVLGIMLPLLGFIWGAILLLDDDSYAKAKGKRCIQWSLMGLLIGFMFWICYALTQA